MSGSRTEASWASTGAESSRLCPPKEAVLALMPDVVDATLARLIDAIDEGVLPLLYRSEKGDLVDLHEAGRGEMSGYYADDAWLRDFSHERFYRSTWTPMCSLRLRLLLPRAAYDVNQADWTVFSTVTRGAQSRQRSQTRAGIPQVRACHEDRTAEKPARSLPADPPRPSDGGDFSVGPTGTAGLTVKAGLTPADVRPFSPKAKSLPSPARFTNRRTDRQEPRRRSGQRREASASMVWVRC